MTNDVTKRQVLIRQLDAAVVNQLKSQAKQHGRALEAELRLILQKAAGVSEDAHQQQLEQIRQLFAGRMFSDSVKLIRADRRR